MDIQVQQEPPPSVPLRAVYTARSTEELNRTLLILRENGVSAYPLDNLVSAIPFPYVNWYRSYRVRIGVPPEDEKEALVVVKALKLRGSIISKSAVSDLWTMVFWATIIAAVAFVLMLVYYRSFGAINYGVLFLVWFGSLIIISQVLGHRHTDEYSMEDDAGDEDEDTK